VKFATNRHIEKVIFPPIVEIKRLVVGDKAPCGKSYIDLCQAVPDYPPAPELVEYVQNRLSDPATALYTSDEGLLDVRMSVCRRYGRVYGASLSADNVCLTVGASQAFWLAMVALCAAGDEVILQVPYYFDYEMALEMLGISRVYAPFHEGTGGLPDVGTIERLITPRTRAILLVTPSNPTGAIAPPEVVHNLLELAERRNIALVLDETYADFIAGGNRPHGLFTRKDWGNHFVHIMSFGKTYAITGYRAGLLVASEAFLHHALKVHDTMAICQPTPTQVALQYGLDHLDSWVAANRRMMEHRHDRFRDEFTKPGNPFSLVSSGAFFAWIKHPFQEATAWAVARDLIEKAGLVTLPGEIFGPGMSRYLRVAFGNIVEDQMPEAASRFRDYA
jgi:aspartate/methionine/tyrosine aminotransferase